VEAFLEMQVSCTSNIDNTSHKEETSEETREAITGEKQKKPPLPAGAETCSEKEGK
jgi:hypothetical protein